MTTKISSLLLARLQVMFTSGMTLQEVTEALDLELAEKEVADIEEKTPDIDPALDTPPEPASEQASEPAPEPASEPGPSPSVDPTKLPPAVLNHLFALVRAVQKLGGESYSLAGHDAVRKSETLLGISKSISDSTQSVAKIVNVISGFAPELTVDDDKTQAADTAPRTQPEKVISPKP